MAADMLTVNDAIFQHEFRTLVGFAKQPAADHSRIISNRRNKNR